MRIQTIQWWRAPAAHQMESVAGQGCPSLHKGGYTCRKLVFGGAMWIQTTQTEASSLCVLPFLLYGNLHAPAVNQMESGAGQGCTPICHFTRYDVHIESWNLMGPSEYRQPNGGGFFEWIAVHIQWQPSCSCSMLKGKWRWSRLYTYLSLYKGLCTCRKLVFNGGHASTDNPTDGFFPCVLSFILILKEWEGADLLLCLGPHSASLHSKLYMSSPELHSLSLVVIERSIT